MNTADSLVDPQIPVHHIQAHILLMRALHKLLVEAGDIPFDRQTNTPRPTPAAAAFIQRAVERFTIWINLHPVRDSHPPDAHVDVPPLDILMVWYSYMLSPSKYYSDSRGAVPVLATLGGMPWDKIVTYINKETATFHATSDQVTRWESHFSIAFRPDADDKMPTQVTKPAFSVDLTAAILRQSNTFVRMLAEVERLDHNWTHHAVIRYLQYLRHHPVGTVPPIDVDIVWHTHQLCGTKYWIQSPSYFGYHPDHDDNLSPAAIVHGQRLTEQLPLKKGLPQRPKCGGAVGGCFVKDDAK